MSNYLVTDTELTQTAAALRTKGGTSEQIEWGSGTGFKSAIEALPSGGGGISITPTVVVDDMTGKKARLIEAIGFSVSASVTTE